MEWAGRVWRVEEKKILINNPTGKHPRGSLRQRWRDGINAHIGVVDGAASFETVIDREKLSGLLVAAKGLNGL